MKYTRSAITCLHVSGSWSQGTTSPTSAGSSYESSSCVALASSSRNRSVHFFTLVISTFSLYANLNLDLDCKRSMSRGAPSTCNYMGSFEKIGRGCIGMKATPTKLHKIMLTTIPPKMIIMIFPLTGSLVTKSMWCWLLTMDTQFYYCVSGPDYQLLSQWRYGFELAYYVCFTQLSRLGWCTLL